MKSHLGLLWGSHASGRVRVKFLAEAIDHGESEYRTSGGLEGHFKILCSKFTIERRGPITFKVTLVTQDSTESLFAQLVPGTTRRLACAVLKITSTLTLCLNIRYSNHSNLCQQDKWHASRTKTNQLRISQSSRFANNYLTVLSTVGVSSLT